MTSCSTRPAVARPLGVKTIVWPTEEPLTADDCRGQVEAEVYDDPDVDPVDDAKFLEWAGAAREYCENFTGRFIARRTVEVALDDFPTGAIVLPFAPVVGVLTVTAAGEEVDAELYTLDDYNTPARVLPASSWPGVTAATNTVKVRCLVGYSEDSDGPNLPKALRAAMLLIVGHLYNNREDSTDKAMATIPTGADAIMRPLRIRKGMA